MECCRNWTPFGPGIQIDTGMNRLGLPPDDVRETGRRFRAYW